MKCQKCNQREANTHIQKIINGNKSEYYLCKECSLEMGEFPFSFKNETDDFFSGFFGSYAKQISSPTENICPTCKTTLSEFLKKGKMGCSHCYESFAESLKKPLQQIHGAAAHTGKIPKRSGKSISLEVQVKHLQKELETAVSNQEFERAASLRDEIRTLKEGDGK